jgi:sulfatase modifying factor 1
MKYAWLSFWFFISATHAQVGDKVVLPNFSIDRTEVTIGQFERYVQATGTVTRAEKEGGGVEYVGGWQRRPGWSWRCLLYTSPSPRDES